jgi:hypothetical protein
MKICTEADYLQAHLTGIAGESRRWNDAFMNLSLRITSILRNGLRQQRLLEKAPLEILPNGMNPHASGVLKF